MNVSGVEKRAVERVHEARSEEAQRTDESFNAPTTTDAEKWANKPDRFDYPGVDTVNEKRQDERAEGLAQFAQEEGVVSSVEVKEEIDFGQSGLSNPMGFANQPQAGAATNISVREDVRKREVDDPRFEFGPVLAHEVGHAIDFGSGKTFSQTLESEPNENLRDEAVTVSKTMRGEFEEASEERIEYRSGEGEGSRELAADFVASRTLQPRATERIAPELTKEFDEEFEEEFGVEFNEII